MTPTIYTYDSLWGHYNSQEVGIVRSGAGRYLCGWIVIIVTNKNLLSQMKCVEARGRETPGFFCLIMSFQQRGFGRVASTGALQQGATAGVHQQGASAGMLQQGCFGRGAHRQGHIGRGTSAGVHRQGYINRGLRQGRFGRVASAGALQLFQNIMSFL